MIDGEFDMADARATFERLAASGERGKAVFRVADAYATTTARARAARAGCSSRAFTLLEPGGPRFRAAIAELAGSARSAPKPATSEPTGTLRTVENPPS
jgi:hypothetical protein